MLLYFINVTLNWAQIYKCLEMGFYCIIKNLLVFKSTLFSQVHIASVYVMFFFKIH